MFILASGSPRRKQLLGSLGIAFEIVSADVDEQNDLEQPQELVEVNAKLKAGHVSKEYPDDWILGSDTTVALGGEILNKPVDMNDARSMLNRMSGRTHTVYTAVCLLNCNQGVEALFTVKSHVSFKRFDDVLITQYFELVNPLDKAGAYGIQEGRELIIEGWDGSYSNIMGLPVDEVAALLKTYALL